MKEFRIKIIHTHCICISTILECMYLCDHIVHVQDVHQKYFWTLNEIAKQSAIYADSIFTMQDFTFSKKDLKHNFSV